MSLTRGLLMFTSEVLRMLEMQNTPRAGSSYLTSQPWWRQCTRVLAERSMTVGGEEADQEVSHLLGMVGEVVREMAGEIMGGPGHLIDIEMSTEMTGIEEDLLQGGDEMMGLEVLHIGVT